MAVISKSLNTAAKELLLAGMTVGGLTIGSNTFGKIDKVAALENGTRVSDIVTFSWATISGGSVSKTGSMIMTVNAGSTVDEIQIFDNTLSGTVEITPTVSFSIDDEEFVYEGTIVIDTLTLSISNTIG